MNDTMMQPPVTIDRLTDAQLRTLDALAERPMHWYASIELAPPLRDLLPGLVTLGAAERHQGQGGRASARFYRITAQGEIIRQQAHRDRERTAAERAQTRTLLDKLRAGLRFPDRAQVAVEEGERGQ